VNGQGGKRRGRGAPAPCGDARKVMKFATQCIIHIYNENAKRSVGFLTCNIPLLALLCSSQLHRQNGRTPTYYLPPHFDGHFRRFPLSFLPPFVPQQNFGDEWHKFFSERELTRELYAIAVRLSVVCNARAPY